MKERRHRWLLRLALLALSIGFRWPVLANAWGLNSDVAVVGLQARHFPQEWAPFLWGSGYQSSTDSLWAALLFAIFGSGPTVLLASALALQVLLTFALFEGARRLLAAKGHADALAFLVATLFVFTPPSVHSYALNPPRQASITIAICGLLLALVAATAPPPRRLWYRGIAVALAGVATYADPYALLFSPAIFAAAILPALFELRAAEATGRGAQAAATGAVLAGGALLGQIPPWLLRHSAAAQNGTLGLDPSRFAHNAEILQKTCLPWALAVEAWAPKHLMDWELWMAPAGLAPLRWLGAFAFCALAASALPLAFSRRIPGLLRVAGLLGLATIVANLASFLGSVMVFDHFAMRYLAGLVIAAPFAVLPAAYRLGPRKFAAVLAPWLLSSSICAWVGYLPFGVTRSAVGRGDDERALRKDLEARGIAAATADYWACYRLDFLWEESIVVVPIHAREERYRPYRPRFEAASTVAYLYDGGRSREGLDGAAKNAEALGTVTERFTEGLFTVFVVKKPQNP